MFCWRFSSIQNVIHVRSCRDISAYILKRVWERERKINTGKMKFDVRFVISIRPNISKSAYQIAFWTKKLYVNEKRNSYSCEMSNPQSGEIFWGKTFLTITSSKSKRSNTYCFLLNGEKLNCMDDRSNLFDKHGRTNA